MKKGSFIGYFISDPKSSFYQSDIFGSILQFAQQHPSQVKLEEKQTRTGLRLLLRMKPAKTVQAVINKLQYFEHLLDE